MEDCNKSSHAIYQSEYHFDWIPKCRYHVLGKHGGDPLHFNGEMKAEKACVMGV